MRRRGGRTPSRHLSTSSSKLTVASCAPEQEIESIQTSSSRVLRIRAARSWVKSVCVCRLDLLFVQPPLPAEPRRGSGPIGVRGSRFPPTGVGGEVEEMEAIGVHDVAEELRKRQAKAAIEEHSKEGIPGRILLLGDGGK